MPVSTIHSWQKAPFIRLSWPLALGILLQHEFSLPLLSGYIFLLISTLTLLFFFTIPFLLRYRYSLVSGIAISFLFLSLGIIRSYQKNICNDPGWFSNHYRSGSAMIVSIEEPPIEKPKSFKAEGRCKKLIKDGAEWNINGKLIIYFKKNSDQLIPAYGSVIIFKKPLQEIRSSGNPGAFNYRRYALFHGITHQVYLEKNDYEIIFPHDANRFKLFLYRVQKNVLSILRENIQDENVCGLAEALLIGYKDDLDKSLVQSYTDTGVVHIIAISGLHLGLIYWLLGLLFKLFNRNKKSNWLRAAWIISGLWLFSLLAGGQPSILRSAIMFSCITIGESFGRKGSIFNTIAISACILMWLDPFVLWDPGFQLSYAAVLSIILFMKPVYNWFYFRNKFIDQVWKLNAVTISAQILTIPICFYHFHQFPNYFLFTNFVAVPLSSLIVLAEIFLCAIYWMPFIAGLTGHLITLMIRFMNTWIERISHLPFPVWSGIQLNISQVVLLYVLIIALSIGILEKKKSTIGIAAIAILLFFSSRSAQFIKRDRQQKIIVYNVPGKTAIDFINGSKSFYTGDSLLITDLFLYQLYLRPARILYRFHQVDSLPGLFRSNYYTSFHHLNILQATAPFQVGKTDPLATIDLLIISGKSPISLSDLIGKIRIHQVILDSSVPTWKSQILKKTCDSLRIPCFDVNNEGAFVFDIPGS